MNNKTMKKIMAVVLLLGVYILTGCDSDVAEDVQIADTQAYSAPMKFRGGVAGFDVSINTRAGDDWTWLDGATVYIQFYNSSSVVRGHAIYTKSSDSWEVFYNGKLGDVDKCEVYFFDGASTTDKRYVSLTDTTPVYADQAGAYSYDGETVILTAMLAPLTSRIRFSGSPDMYATISGLSCYNAYNAETNTFTSSTAIVRRTVNSDGMTPYIYGIFANADTRQLTIENSADEVFYIKSFDASVLQVGESGYMALPTENNNKGWNTQTPPDVREFTIQGNGKTVTFRMLRVGKGTFNMGSNDGNDNEKPVHSVTLTETYYLGETEVTQALWYAVTGKVPSSEYSSEDYQWNSYRGYDDDCAAYYISPSLSSDFLAKLNLLTGEHFRLPTEAEWEYAARGGRKSQGYLYPGSNNIEDVGWCSPAGGVYSSHFPVKQISPNELGFYDMAGNVEEWCSDWYTDTYSLGSQMNPTGPENGDYHVIRGGSVVSSSVDCRITSRKKGIAYYLTGGNGCSDYGLRIAL